MTDATVHGPRVVEDSDMNKERDARYLGMFYWALGVLLASPSNKQAMTDTPVSPETNWSSRLHTDVAYIHM